jgi:hypothetical protein
VREILTRLGRRLPTERYYTDFLELNSAAPRHYGFLNEQNDTYSTLLYTRKVTTRCSDHETARGKGSRPTVGERSDERAGRWEGRDGQRWEGRDATNGLNDGRG